MPKQTVIRPTGVVTQPNEYGDLPPGTLSVGDGIQIRRSHVIEPRNSFQDWSVLDATYDQAVKLWPWSIGSLVVGRKSDNTTRLFYSQPTPSPFVSNVYYGEIGDFIACSPGKTHFSQARDRMFVTNDQPPLVYGEFGGRQAGIAPLFISDITETTGGSIWLEDKYVAYAAVLRLTDSDGYVVRGAVSNKYIAHNNAGADRLATVRLIWPSDFDSTINNFFNITLELYRVPQQESAGLLGDEYRLAVEHKISSADIAAGYVDLLDTCLETGLSTYMYTNPSQKGPDKTYNMPPPSTDVVTFKGATFYNTTSIWHKVATRIPNKWGALSTADEIAHGIGSRSFVGNFTTTQSTFTVADATGIKVGQIIRSTVPGVDLTTVTNVAGLVITFSGTAGATLGSTISIYDVIVIDGVSLDAHTPQHLVRALGAAMIAGTVQTSLYAAPTLDRDDFSVEGQILTFINAVPPNSFTIKATNGQNYSPPLTEFSGTAATSTDDPRTNRVHYSEFDQPENVPLINTFLLGSGTILKLWATQDSLFAFCSDGIFRIDGHGDDWSVKPVDPDTILLAPDAVDSMDNQIYAFTTAGLISLSDSGGVKKISAPFIDEDLRELWNQFTEEDPPLPYTWGVQLACDKFRNEVWLNFNDYKDDGFVQTWIWNVNTETFVTQSAEEPSAIAYAPEYRTMLLGSDALRTYDPDNWMATDVEFNSIFADDLGLLKQWIDVTLFFEDLGDVSLFLPRFEGLEYDDAYEIPATAGAFDHVVAPLLTAVCNKHIRFGYVMDEAEGESDKPYYKLKGVTYRYRLAAEPLRQ